MKVVKIILITLGCLVVIMSLIPLIRHDFWTFRVFEFPRAQKFILNLIILIVFLFFWNSKSAKEIAFLTALVLNQAYLSYLIFPYTPFASKQIKLTETLLPDKSLSVMVANVYQYNTNTVKLKEIIEKNDPDVVLLVETNSWWLDQMKDLEEDFPHTIYQPQDNTYGMLLFSKYPLEDISIKYLIEYGVPSIHAKTVLPSGDRVQLYCIHPEPPVPTKDPRSTERDAEILLVGQLAKDNPLPVVVAGDLNDVAWSYTTELFIESSGLLDPRRGRGFYSTFHAKYFFLRWPLDHLFCSNDFKLVGLKTLEAFGSDHFPIMIQLVLVPGAPQEQPKPEAEEDEQQEAQEKIEKGKKMQRKPHRD
jgi:endonuclease/exonuclease/phosphatase (EEP) superfamily protein YafD